MSVTFGQWQHKGTVLASSSGHNPQQPSVIYEANAKILSGTVFKMWYNDYNGSIAQLSYAESTNGTSWTTYSSNPLISGQGFSKVYKNGSTYYAYTSDITFTFINVYTSSDGITWTLQKANAITVGSAGQWDASHTTQLNIIDIIGGTWYGYYAGNSGSVNAGQWSMGLATSTDGINWTKGASNPVITYEGPSNFDWHKINGVYYGWSQIVLPNIPYSGGSVVFPSDIIRFKSGSVTGPFTPLPTPVFQRTQSSEGPTVTGGQVADPCIVSDGTNLWMFFTATANGNSSGPWMINAAEAPSTTFAQLVATYEGIQTFPIYTLKGLALTESVVTTDSFQRANENPVSDGGAWQTGLLSTLASAQLLNDQVTGTTVSKGSEMYLTAVVGADQWAQTVVGKSLEATGNVGVLVRGATAAWSEYRFFWAGIAGSSGTFTLQTVLAGSSKNTHTFTGTVNIGDTMTMVVIGTNVFCYWNGYLIIQLSDTNNASGEPGLIVYGGSTTATDAALSSWSGGNVITLPASIPNKGSGLLLGVG